MDKQLYTDNVHIIINHIHRIPLGFLKKHLAVYPGAMEIICKIESYDGTTALAFYTELSNLIKNTDDAYDCLNSALNSVISSQESSWLKA